MQAYCITMISLQFYCDESRTSVQWHLSWLAVASGLVVMGQYRPIYSPTWWVGSRVVSVLDSGAEGPGGFKSQSRRCRVTVLGKLFTPVVPLFTKQQNW